MSNTGMKTVGVKMTEMVTYERSFTYDELVTAAKGLTFQKLDEMDSDALYDLIMNDPDLQHDLLVNGFAGADQCDYTIENV